MIMYSNSFILNSIKQVRCVCKSRVFLKNICYENLARNVQVKVQLQQVCCASTESNTEKSLKSGVFLKTEKGSLLEVYRGSISQFIYRVKAFSLMTSAFGIATQPIVLNSALNSETNTGVIIGAFCFIGFFTFVTPILLHMLTKRYVLLLEYCPKNDEYYATTYSFFLRSIVHKFRAKDVLIPDIPGMLTSFEVNKQPFFVDRESFKDIEHYKKIMGFDKPLDFKLHKSKDIKKE